MRFKAFEKVIPEINKLSLPGLETQLKMAPSFRKKLIEHFIEARKSAKLAAVLSLFYPSSTGDTNIVLILRKVYNGVHSAQVGFPGGKPELEDASLKDTAVRETWEEIGVSPENILVLREVTPIYIPPSNFQVHPFIAISNIPLNFTLQESEVDDTIEVYAPIKKKTFTEDNIFDELKVLPENYNVVKALLGDNSDNLAGVKGLGIKTIIAEFPDLVNKSGTTLDYVYDVCAKKLEEKKFKKIFPKIITEWDRVETNYKLMDLNVSDLDDKEKTHVVDIIKSEVPDLQVGAFLHCLDTDKIEGITKNTEAWLENFRPLTTVK